MRLGKTEKLILGHLRLYERCLGHASLRTDSTESEYHGYRAQILVKLYRQEGGQLNGRRYKNLRSKMPPDVYDSLQSRLTKSLKSLENKGLINRISVDQKKVGKWFKKRRWRFHLSEIGRRKGIGILRNVENEVQGNARRIPPRRIVADPTDAPSRNRSESWPKHFQQQRRPVRIAEGFTG